MTAVYICECGHPKSQHKREREGCRALDCECSQFKADMAASAAAQGVHRLRVEAAVLPVLESEAAKSRTAVGIPAAEALAKAEQERDQFIAAADKLHGEWLDLKADLASAQKEIEQQRELRRDLFASYERVVAQLAEARAAAEEKVRAEPAANVLHAYDAWSCLTEGGCGSRYTRETAIQDHPCGPLTAVRVTITHRTEGQQ